MSLKVLLTSLDDVPEPMRESYRRLDDGRYMLDIAGIDDHPDVRALKAAHEREKARRAGLDTDVTSLRAELEKVAALNADLPVIQAALAKMRNAEEQELLKKGDLDELVARRTTAMKSDFERQLRTLTETAATRETEAKQAQHRLAETKVEQAIRDAAAKVGIRPTAITDAIARARNVFSYHDDAVVALDADGQVKVGKDGKAPMSPAEYLASLEPDASHLFDVNTGAGARGGQGNGRGRDLGVVVIDPNDSAAIGRNLAAIREGKFRPARTD